MIPLDVPIVIVLVVLAAGAGVGFLITMILFSIWCKKAPLVDENGRIVKEKDDDENV